MGLVHKTSSFLLATPRWGGEGGGYSGASVATVLLKQTVENKLIKNEAPINCGLYKGDYKNCEKQHRPENTTKSVC